MTPETVVWHGVERQMKFESFAPYFECPTSTSTSKIVAQGFSGWGGMILKLKSKFKNSCSVMLDVSVFSNYPEECERLFVKETLIIHDVMMRVDDEWTSFGLYFQALVYFEVCCKISGLNNLSTVYCCWCLFYGQKITTGNATNDSWNISESKKVQKTLALIISDYVDARSNVKAVLTSKIPRYIRTLFKHYCSKNIKPDFHGIDQIQEKMTAELQFHFFVDTIPILGTGLSFVAESGGFFEGSEEQTYISRETVLLLFPNATIYINDQAKEIEI